MHFVKHFFYNCQYFVTHHTCEESEAEAFTTKNSQILIGHSLQKYRKQYCIETRINTTQTDKPQALIQPHSCTKHKSLHSLYLIPEAHTSAFSLSGRSNSFSSEI